MRPHRVTSSDGLTLTELLTVVAIVGMMAAAATPAVMSMLTHSRDKSRAAARETYALLRAAQQQAATHREKHAVAYVFDQDDSGRQFIIATVVLRATTVDPGADYDNPAEDSEPEYVPVENSTGNIQPLRKGSCIYLGGIGTVPSDVGMKLIDVFTEDDELDLTTWAATPRPVGQAQWDNESRSNVIQSQVWAHVFKPSGEVISQQDQTKQRFELWAGLHPSEMEAIEYYGGEGDYENEVLIELFHSTGRIKVGESRFEQ